MCKRHNELYQEWERHHAAARKASKASAEYSPCLDALQRLRAHCEVCPECQAEMQKLAGEHLVFDNLSEIDI